MITQVQIEALLTTFRDPYTQVDVINSKMVKKLTIEGDKVSVLLELSYPCQGLHDQISRELRRLLMTIPGIKEAEVALSFAVTAHTIQTGLKRLPMVKNTIAIASGKGGVGKSTVAANLALALVKEGARCGILDADIYGPSLPLMLGGTEKPEILEGNKFVPIQRHGLQIMSIGYLIDIHTPMIWRGPMVSTALQQLMFDTAWDNLDYLIIDLPPGTGDIQLTLSQKIPLSGSVIVTTPQELAVLDARRACAMFAKVNVPVLGIIENMSYHTCTACGHAESLFGSGGGQKLAAEYGVSLLGAIPLERAIREDADRGLPTVASHPDTDAAGCYIEIARKMAATLALQGKDYSLRFPNIVIQQD